MNRRALFSFLAAAPVGAYAVVKEVAAATPKELVPNTTALAALEEAEVVKNTPFRGELRQSAVYMPYNTHTHSWTPEPAGMLLSGHSISYVNTSCTTAYGETVTEIYDGERWLRYDSAEGIALRNDLATIAGIAFSLALNPARL